jgi:cytochrome c
VPHDAPTNAGQSAPRETRASAREILARRACTTCHAFDRKVVGPAFAEVATRYRGRQEAVNYLVERIRKGSVGARGDTAMPGQATISDEEVHTVARWIVLGAQ